MNVGGTLMHHLSLEGHLAAEIQKIYHEAATARARLIGFVPNVKHNQTVCIGTKNQQRCELNWQEAYGTYTRLLCHTERFYSARSVLDKISREEIKDMNEICQADMVEMMRNAFLREEDIFIQGKASLLNLLHSIHPCNPRRAFTSNHTV